MSRKWLMVALLLVALVGSTALAAPVKNFDRVLDSLWGSDITAGELLQLTCPDMLARLPQSAWNTKVIWGPRDGGGVIAEAQYTPKKTEAIQDTDASSNVEPSVSIPIIVYCDSRISASGRSVYYGASSTVTIPPFLRMQYMSVEAVLRGSDGTWASTWDDGYDVWRVTTNDTADVGGNADYWTVGYHYVIFPEGSNPPFEYLVSRSRTIWVP